MDKRFDKLDEKLEVLDTRLSNIDKILLRQELNLELHMKRSQHLEEIVEMMKEDNKPLHKHVAMVEGILKFLGFLLVVGGVIAGFWQALK